MTEFWEKNFSEKKEMWGLQAANCALKAAELFASLNFKNVLIPGIGYGRNAAPFLDYGMQVTGIEISQTAIELAQERFGDLIGIHHGSVSDMPFDDKTYDGIFCHALIHLLGENERGSLIANCYQHLEPGGSMIFTAITKQSPTFGKGDLIGPDRYEQFGGVQIFFYDEDSIKREFMVHGLNQIDTVTDNFPFHFIHCEKKSTE